MRYSFASNTLDKAVTVGPATPGDAETAENMVCDPVVKALKDREHATMVEIKGTFSVVESVRNSG